MLPGQRKLADLQDAVAARPVAQVAHGGLVGAEDGDHAAGGGVGGGLHRLAALPHHAQAVAEAHGPREDQGGVLAEAEAGGAGAGGDHVGLRRLQRFEGGEAADEDGGLADDGGVEPLGRALGADRGEVVAEHLGRLVEQPPRRGQGFAELPAHADRLAALAGEEEGDLRHGDPPSPRRLAA